MNAVVPLRRCAAAHVTSDRSRGICAPLRSKQSSSFGAPPLQHPPRGPWVAKWKYTVQDWLIDRGRFRPLVQDDNGQRSAVEAALLASQMRRFRRGGAVGIVGSCLPACLPACLFAVLELSVCLRGTSIPRVTFPCFDSTRTGNQRPVWVQRYIDFL